MGILRSSYVRWFCLTALLALSFPGGIHTGQAIASFGPATGSCTYHTYTVMAPGDTGIQLDTTVRVPNNTTACPKPAAGWPMIVSAHGFGGSKADMDNRARTNASNGYIAVNASWRGHGNSTGTFTVLTQSEWNDLRSLTDWLLHTYTNTATAVNPNRIGIDGVGLGSQIAWMALTQNMGYRDAVPGSFAGYAWDVMVPNNCVNNNINTFWLKPNVRLDPAIKQELWNDYLNLNTVQPLLDFFQSPDRNWSTSLNRLQGQVFAQGSWTDTYQFASAIIPTYANDPVSPKRMYLASNGEEDFDKFSDVSTQNETYRTQWHQRWLQDVQNGIDQGDPVTYLGYLPGDPANPANHTLVINTPAWPPAGVTSKTMYLDSHGSLAESAPHQHNSSDILTNTLLDPTYTITNAVYDESPAFALTWTKIPTSSVTYTSPPLAQDVWWLGAPSVSYYTSATGPNYNIVALYYDLDPATGARYLITRDQSCWHAGDPANRTVTGVPIARRLAAGHEIQVVFQNNDPETSRPRFIAQRIRPVFGNVTMTLYHESSRSTHTDLPLKPDQPSQPIFR